MARHVLQREVRGNLVLLWVSDRHAEADAPRALEYDPLEQLPDPERIHPPVVQHGQNAIRA